MQATVAQSATVAYSATPQVGVVKPLRAQNGGSLVGYLRSPRYEVLPTDDAADRVAAYVPRDVTITVTASPRRGMPATVRLAVRLANLGYHAVPHLSARMIRDSVELGQIIDALKAAGITPFGMGNKDGYGGAWFFSLIGKQNLDSINELKDAMIGKADFSDPRFSGFYKALADLKKKGYLNSDVASISFEQGFQLFGQKKVGMSWGTDGNVAAWEKQIGAKNMGVSGIPVWGHGKLATSYDTTQSSDAFITKWSKHPRAAAQFLVFLHSPAALKAWYAATGVFPADKRFPSSLVRDPIAKKMLALDKSPVSVWPENFVPPQVDGNADLAAGEMITSGSGSPADAVKLWQSSLKQWKSQHPDEFRSYQKWVAGH